MKKALAQLKWHTEQRKIKDLTPYEFNPRKLTDEKRDKLIASIAKFNLAEIPIINKDNVIIAGHQRIKVLLYLDRGEEIIDVRVPNRQLTKFEYKEYNITSNISNGYWDVDVLDAAFSDIDLDALGLDVDNIELPNIDFPEDLISKEDIYEIPVLDEITTNIVKGDIIEFKGSNGEYHRLMCGDATDNKDVTKLMGGVLADMAITDPPYNVDYQGKAKSKLKIINDNKTDDDFYIFLLTSFININNYLKEGSACYVWFASTKSSIFEKAFINANILLKQILIWNKSSFVLGRQDYHWKHEPCIYGWKPGAAHNWYNDRKQTTILDFDRPNRNEHHPTMKPLELIKYQISNSSKLNDIVCDSFLGSGTTMLASHELQRKCYGLELDKKYCQVIINRMIDFDNSLQIFINNKKYISVKE